MIDSRSTPMFERGQTGARYRFGFAMTTSLGNGVAARNLYKYAKRDGSVDILWSPITHWLEPDPYRWLPGPLHTQAILNAESRALRRNWGKLDVVVVHAFQLFAYLATLKRRGPGPLLAISQDYAPFADVEFLRAVGQDVSDGPSRRARLWVQRAYTRRADLLFPRTAWAAESLLKDCQVPADRVFLARHGVDLEVWRPVPPRQSSALPRLLFVGSPFEAKGGPLLLDVFRKRLMGRAELHLLTANPPIDVPPGVFIHDRQAPNSAELRSIYAASDVFVLPTRGDCSPLVALEAMASGLPVVSTSVGGVPEIVADGKTGILVPVDDGRALGQALDYLLTQPAVRAGMGAAGRERVERCFSAERNAGILLGLMKQAVDTRRHMEER